MNIAMDIKRSIRDIGVGLRRPEELALRWRDAAEAAPSPLIIVVMLANALVGVSIYGLTIHMHDGAGGMLFGALAAPICAGFAWAIALPALHIVGAAFGSRRRVGTTLLAATAMVSFGATALLASVPINWFFTLALPEPEVRLAINALVFTGVGVCMGDVFLRVMRALEPELDQTFNMVWLGLVALIGTELALITKLFVF